jgi:hypothetical protein
MAKAPLPIILQSLGAQGPGATSTLLTFGLHSFLNGRVRGTFHQAVAGTLLIEMGDTQTVFDTTFAVPRDASMPGFAYPFDIILIQPFTRFTFTNGGAPSTFFRSSVVALPF